MTPVSDLEIALPKGSRRVRCHSLRALFGFQTWTAQRKELVASLLEGRGIRAQPPISEAGLHDWIFLSLPVMPPPDDSSPDPRPSDEWFEYLMSVHLDTEREVEMYFASPLFHGLGYTSEHEAAGFRFDMWEGVTRRRVEADLVYFEDERRSLTDGSPLILVEAKGTDQVPDAGTGQVKSYAYWVKPAYYVTTNGDVIVVYNYQGGAVPDVTREAQYLMSRSLTSNVLSYVTDLMSFIVFSTRELPKQHVRLSLRN